MNGNPDLVYGPAYSRYRLFLKQTEPYFNNERQLLGAVNRAIRRIPYYRDIYGDLQVSSIQEFESTIQFIDKDLVTKHFDSFLNPDIDLRKCDWGTTGGTSGKPLRLVAPKSRYITELATMHAVWGRAGYDYHPRAVIRNHRLGKGVSYRINPITRELIFDGFRLEDSYFETIYRTIKDHNIHFIHCYPSTAYEFSRYLHRRNLDVSFIHAFLCGSENVFDYQVDLIRHTLGILFHHWYGHSEKLILAGYCRHTSEYHVEPTYGYFELIDEHGRVIRETGRAGEMVGTGFHNNAQVFIRYKTGDYAEYAGGLCPACGRRVTLLRNIQGRWSGSRIFNADGTFITTTALNLHSGLNAFIEGLQFIQERKGELRILIIRSHGYRKDHEKALHRHFREKFKKDMNIRIEYVNRLQRLSNGKFVQLITHVKDQ